MSEVKRAGLFGWNMLKYMEVQNTISRLQHNEVKEATQAGQAGLGGAALQQLWSKANRRKQKTMVVDEVINIEEESFHITFGCVWRTQYKDKSVGRTSGGYLRADEVL